MSKRMPMPTGQAEREASGSHPFGRYLEEFEVGDVYRHWPAKTITEAESHLFCLATMNHHPLHVNDVYAAASQQGRNVVAGPLVYALAFGMTVNDVSGKAIANLATEELSHPAPVFHGDTLFVESEVLETRESPKPDRGTVKVHTRAYNQGGALRPSSSGWCWRRGGSRRAECRRALSNSALGGGIGHGTWGRSPLCPARLPAPRRIIGRRSGTSRNKGRKEICPTSRKATSVNRSPLLSIGK